MEIPDLVHNPLSLSPDDVGLGGNQVAQRIRRIVSTHTHSFMLGSRDMQDSPTRLPFWYLSQHKF